MRRHCSHSPRLPLRYRLLEAWVRLKRRLGFGRPGGFWRGPDEEPALVRVGPPRRPLLSDGVALELPRQPDDTDAYGREL